MFDLGIQSFQELSQEFLASVFGTGPTGQTSLVCGAAAGASGLQTSFHLDPFLQEECAGTDWVGKNTLDLGFAEWKTRRLA